MENRVSERRITESDQEYDLRVTDNRGSEYDQSMVVFFREKLIQLKREGKKSEFMMIRHMTRGMFSVKNS